MSNVRLIAAVGKHGQIGLGGKLPWKPDKGDLAHFSSVTAGGILLMGWATAKNIDVRKLVTYGRTLALITKDGLALIRSADQGVPEMVPHLGEDVLHTPERVLNFLAGGRFEDRTIWVAGGARVYDHFGPYCRHADIGLIDYDGKADTFFPAMAWMRPV